MSPEELEILSRNARGILEESGLNPKLIEERPLRATAMWLYESRLALNPFPLAIAYQAIAWTLKQKLKEAGDAAMGKSSRSGILSEGGRNEQSTGN